MFHVMVLARDQAAQMQHNPPSFVALPGDGRIGVLKRAELLPIPLAFPLKLLGNFLLKNKRLESIVTLFLSAGKTDRKSSSVVLLLIDETCQAAILALVVLDLDFEILCFFGESVCKGLEFEELHLRISESGLAFK
jgi:hypothetical protein